jgi:hypothetical protein
MNYIINKDQYNTLKAAWKKEATHSSVDMIAYNILRGFDAKRGFTPIRSVKKLTNGMKEWQAFNDALSTFKRYLEGAITPSRWNPESQKQYQKQLEKYGLEYSEAFFGKILEAIKNVQ